MNTVASEMNRLFNLFDRESALLEDAVRSCPASSLARLLLLKKYKENADSKYVAAATTIPVYLSNPLWYSFLLSQTDGLIGQDDTGHFAVSFPETKTQETGVIQEDQMAAVLPVETDFHQGETGTITEDKNNDFSEQALTPVESDEVNDGENELQDQSEFSEENANNEEIKTSEIELPVQNQETQPLSSDTIQQETDTPSSHDEKELNDQEIISEEKASDEEIKVKENEVPVQNEVMMQLSPGTIQQEAESPHLQDEKELNKEVEVSDNNEPIAFEPLHTIDFFASQGIRLREEDLENDKLGRQLKSFTGWLKSMKRLHPGRLPEQDDVIEKIIQTSAEGSNMEVDVLTEAMAEVLVKQNKKDKAIEMYNKLSLMNPSKSAYFAAKIESLKTY